MDADVLANVGLAAGGLAWAAAWMDAEIANEALSIALEAHQKGGSDIPHSVLRAMIESVRLHTPHDLKLDAVVGEHLNQLDSSERDIAEQTPSTTDALIQQGLSADVYPVRTIESLVWPPINGTGEFLAKLPADHDLKREMSGYDYVATYQRIYEILNLCDGRNTWLEVQHLVAQQFEGTTHAEVASLAKLLLDAGALRETGGNRQ